MAVIDKHVLWTFFASLFGVVLLYIIRCNNNANSGKLKKKNFPQQCNNNNSFIDREFRHVSGSDSDTDVVVVSAVVAGAALPYTLGKVQFSKQNPLFLHNYYFFFSVM